MAELLRQRKHINVITAEFKPYWEQLFADNGIENPLFYAKMCYQGSEFEVVDGRKSECIRFYPSEISKNQDVFVELFDWYDNPYEESYRNLYRLKNKPDWRTTPNFCVEVTKKRDGSLLPTPTYAVRLIELELISRNKIKTAYPEMTKTSTSVEQTSQATLDLEFKEVDLGAFEEELPFTEKEDNHYASMTIRDIYCIVNKVPLSNKKWLNTLIDEGKKWQK
jgi:hypothetical protein